MELIKNLKLESIFVFVLIFSVLFVAAGSLLDHSLTHEFPFAYFASDSFMDQTTVAHVADVENNNYYSFYTAYGYEDVFQSRPILLSQTAGMISKLFNIYPHDAVYIVILFSLVIIFLLVYCIIRRFNKKAAMLSIPFGLLMFKAPFNLVLLFGQWYFIMGVIYFIALLWIIGMDFKKNYLLLGLLFASSVFIHLPETFFVVFFAPFIFIINSLEKKKIDWKFIKCLIVAGLIGIILSSWFLFISSKTEIPAKTSEFEESPLFSFTIDTKMSARGFADVDLSNFGFYIIPLILGFILFLFSKEALKNKGAIIGVITLIIGFMTYLNFEKRAFAHRWFWPVYFCIFIGITLVFLLKMIKKEDIKLCFLVGVIAFIFMMFSIKIETNPGIMNSYDWEAMKWTWADIPKEKPIYFLYGPPMVQRDNLANSKHIAYSWEMDDVREKFSRNFNISEKFQFVINYNANQALCKSDKGFGYYNKVKEDGGVCEISKYPLLIEGMIKNKTLCEIEYLYLNYNTGNSQIDSLNKYISSKLKQNQWISTIHQNQGVEILKNGNPGKECEL